MGLLGIQPPVVLVLAMLFRTAGIFSQDFWQTLQLCPVAILPKCHLGNELET